jgi:hypothetical protein
MWLELNVPVPPSLARLCGYPGEARYVGLCWQPCGDECEFDDGRSCGTGSWQFYLGFTQHRAVAPALAPFDLGSSDAEPTHLLVIDGQERKAFVADLRTGREFLRRQQHPELSEAPTAEAAGGVAAFLDLADLAGLAGWQETALDEAVIEARMQRQAEELEEMLRFLDGFLQP